MVKQQSTQNPSQTNDSRFKGVRKRKWGKYVSEIRLPNSRERIWLGSYDIAEKAARAFDAALFCLRGPSAKFNFPNNPPDIAGGRSLTPSEIQAAAARFANLEPPRTESPKIESSHSPSPSMSISEGTVQLDSDLTLDESFTDLFTSMGWDNQQPDYGIFPEFDDICGDYYTPSMATQDYKEENTEVVFNEESFLWNF